MNRPLLIQPLLLGFLLAFTPRAQVVNGSFEESGVFTTDGWQFVNTPPDSEACRSSLTDTPPDGGAWALSLPMRGYQGGCFTVASQTLSEAQSGEVWQATAWAQIPPERGDFIPARLYLTTFEPGEDPIMGVPPPLYFPGPYGSTAETVSPEWTLLTVTDTLFLALDDSVGVVLDAGPYTGPEFGWEWAGFDLVTAERIGTVAAEVPPEPSSPTLVAWPNPSRGSSEVRFTLPVPSAVRLSVYDLLGREVTRLAEGAYPPGEHRYRLGGAALPVGVYLLRLTADTHALTRKLVRLE